MIAKKSHTSILLLLNIAGDFGMTFKPSYLGVTAGAGCAGAAGATVGGAQQVFALEQRRARLPARAVWLV